MGKKMLHRELTRCAGVHEEIEAAKKAFQELSKQGKHAEAVEHLYTENALLGISGADLSPARASACVRACTRVRELYRCDGVDSR